MCCVALSVSVGYRYLWISCLVLNDNSDSIWAILLESLLIAAGGVSLTDETHPHYCAFHKPRSWLHRYMSCYGLPLCSMFWDKSWLFAMSIVVELCKLELSFFFFFFSTEYNDIITYKTSYNLYSIVQLNLLTIFSNI
jgi:hypothetical protein